jgi:hypothetical protein
MIFSAPEHIAALEEIHACYSSHQQKMITAYETYFSLERKQGFKIG